MMELQERLEIQHFSLEEAKRSREGAENDLRGSEVELSMADASVHALEVYHLISCLHFLYIFFVRIIQNLSYRNISSRRKLSSSFAGKNSPSAAASVSNFF